MQDSFIDFLSIELLLPPDFKLDLQRFASADSEGRTEKATDHKRKKAREEGRVALSKDLPAAVITLVLFSTIVLFGSYILNVIGGSMHYVLENFMNLSASDGMVYKDIILMPFLKIFIPLGVLGMLTGIITNYGQIGFKVTPKSLKPDFKKIVPDIIKYFNKQVFSVSGYFNLLKSIVKIAIIVFVAFFTVKARMDEVVSIALFENLGDSFEVILSLVTEVFFKIALLLIVFSAVDILFVRWQFEEQQKMKKQEVKEEFKELEGDPQVKQKLKQMYRSLIDEQKTLSKVPEADVVITNPTHYAVALQYKSAVDDRPRVIAKGEDRLAQEIKKIAQENDIFMYENVPLARALYAEVRENDYIPVEFVDLVVIAYKLAYEYDYAKGAKV